jgi:hypothetical protein
MSLVSSDAPKNRTPWSSDDRKNVYVPVIGALKLCQRSMQPGSTEKEERCKFGAHVKDRLKLPVGPTGAADC